MSDLLFRSYRLEIDDILIKSISKGRPAPDALAVGFSISRDDSPNPNSAEFVIANLNRDHRLQLSKGDQVVRFQAGYGENLDLLFYGLVRRSTSSEMPTVLTRVQAGDADSQIVTSKVSKSFAKGALVSDVVRTLAKGIGVKPGNLEQWVDQASTKGGPKLPHGLALEGDAAANLSAICGSLDWTWCVQNGELLIGPSKKKGSVGPLISKETGLIGTPQLGAKNVVTFQTLLLPGVVPRAACKLVSNHANGVVLIKKTRHYGEIDGSKTQIDVEGELFNEGEL